MLFTLCKRQCLLLKRRYNCNTKLYYGESKMFMEHNESQKNIYIIGECHLRVIGKKTLKKSLLKCWSPSIVLLVGMQNSKDILKVVFKEVNVEGDVKRITDVGWKCGITTLSILITWTSTQPFSQTSHKLDLT